MPFAPSPLTIPQTPSPTASRPALELVAQLNEKLAAGMQKTIFLRGIPESEAKDELAAFFVFAKTGLQSGTN
ncbi:hypothetical protein N0V90_012525 [Kalmusia sp. IMI 367209]|nr:hypothetical protein N0V90_012525 [Kalmusia sp. IMI 367209]